MGLIRAVEPGDLAVCLADAKKHCELPEFDYTHDDHITRLIKSATRDVERHTRRALITQTWRLSLREFPHLGCWIGRIHLPRPPLVSVSSLVYVNTSGVETTLSASLYQVSTDSSPGYMEPAFGQVWPTVRTETADAINITYVSGFGASHEMIPDEFKQLICELVAFRFTARGDTQVGIPQHIRWSLDSLRCGAQYDYFGIKG